MSYTEQLTEEINDFITEKVKDLDNYKFKEVMYAVRDDIDAQLEAVESDEAANEEENE